MVSCRVIEDGLCLGVVFVQSVVCQKVGGQGCETLISKKNTLATLGHPGCQADLKVAKVPSVSSIPGPKYCL